jgi:superfamily II DNA/RNA helicase
MLDMGFKDDLEFILKKIPAAQRQTLLFSATFPSEITKIAHKYMRDPEKIEVSSGYTPAVGLTHKFARVPKDKKIQALGTLLRGPDLAASITADLHLPPLEDDGVDDGED